MTKNDCHENFISRKMKEEREAKINKKASGVLIGQAWADQGRRVLSIVEVVAVNKIEKSRDESEYSHPHLLGILLDL